ncbi:MAG: FecR domain-containing protein [Alphaproteobacteria bacterium]|nr:FecR domain-containing protein [Alphaproteobacteria bacterium]
MIAALAVIALLVLGVQAGLAQNQNRPQQELPSDEDYVVVRYGPDLSLRAMAEQYLDDPDLWPIILRLNGFEDITDIADDQELRLPANQVQAAISGLATSLVIIQAANEAGAQLFAPVLIGTAIRLRDNAIKENQAGSYSQSINLSTQSIDRAESARVKSTEQRDVAAEARLSDRHGRVEGQKTTENSWSDRVINAVLNEQEKLRTLSESTAQVVFRDASRLRLNPNSQAVIQRMRVDPLKRREEAQISLIEGDFYALLATESKRNRLEVSLPNADAKIDSGSFWVSQDDDTAKFSNYDVKPVSISAGGETLVLGRNEGALVRTGEAPKEKISVHSRIALNQPEDNALLFGDTVALEWEAGEEATEYWVEVAYDPRFDRMAESLWGVKANRIDELQAEPGVYFWRVAAIDPFGLPGQMSTVRRFEIRIDGTPPFLQIDTPIPQAIIRDASLAVTGETEPDAELSINDLPVEVGPDGSFFHTVTAQEGDNTVRVVTRDPAGNETVRKVEFSYMKDDSRDIVYDAELPRDGGGRFLTAGDTLTVSGTILSGAKLSVLDEDGALRSETYADGSGQFLVNVPLENTKETLTVQVSTASGHSYSETIEAQRLDKAPSLNYAQPLPAVTSDPALELEILVDQDAVITVNGETARLDGGKASVTLDLVEGPNLVETIATNAVGLVTIDKRTVIFDSLEPVVTEQVVSVEPSGGKELVSFKIGAKDATGVAKTSRYRLQIGDQEYRGVLRFNRARKSYQGKTEVPLRMNDEGLTVEIEIADVAGNVSIVTLTQ